MKQIKTSLIAILFLSTLLSCFAIESPTSSAAPISHEIWDGLLKKHVSATGYVDYGGFAKDQASLKKYLDMVSSNAPAKSWSTNEKLAYWINAYNAFTVQLILDNADQKITSIKDIGSKIKIPFVNTPWDVKFIKIGGKEMDLNNIEHGIIRKEFSEPRIHFALVCAAKSCPPLRNEAFVASKLSAQLDDQGVKFINDPSKNKITNANSAQLSKLLDWYGGDFKKGGKTVIDWVNKYSKTKLKSDASISYLEYYWPLNGKL
ncbi:Protein of unknown function, DUF547 [Spirosomataceae bacterium TFI 002]|nr:Protein of unknown function, DUF547 [Spirosomataceae bacterium TFI 002]